MLGQLFDIAYVEARKIWYFRWTAALIALVLIVLAAAVIYFLPNVYNAWGQIYVSKSTPLSVATEDISFSENKYGNPYLIQRTILSDRNIERVIKKLDPSFERLDKVKRELAIASMRSSISISTDDQFIEFHVKGQDPVRARLIAKTVMDQFVDDSMKLNRSDLAQASEFLGQQLEAYRELLAESQTKLASFSRQHPQVVAVAAPRGDSGGRMVSVPVEAAATESSGPSGPDTGALDGAIADLERRVADLLTQYTEQYPDVVAARRKIATLQAQRAAVVAAAAVRASAAPAAPAVAAAPPAPRRYVTVPAPARSSAPPRVAPDLAAQWEALERENELLADNYQKLVERREAAKMSLAVYKSDAPGKFQVTREPAVPNIPTGPNRPLYLAIAAIAALVAGLGAAYLRAAITGIFVSSRELEDAFHLPVVGTVSWEPAWHTGADKSKPLALPFLGKGGQRVTAVTRTISL